MTLFSVRCSSGAKLYWEMALTLGGVGWRRWALPALQNADSWQSRLSLLCSSAAGCLQHVWVPPACQPPPPSTWLSSSGSEHREQRWYSRSTLKSCLYISLHLEVVLLPEAVYLNRSLLPRQESQLCLLMFLQIQGVYRSAFVSLFLGTASSNALDKQTLLYRTPIVPSKYILHKCI